MATLKWFKGGEELEAGEQRENQGSAVSDLDVLLDETDNGAAYKCEASNPATETPFSNTTVLNVACELLETEG